MTFPTVYILISNYFAWPWNNKVEKVFEWKGYMFRRSEYWHAYLVFVSWVEWEFTNLLVAFTVFRNMANGQLNTLQQGRFRGITIAFPVKYKLQMKIKKETSENHDQDLLFISYKFVKGFWQLLFYYLLFLTETLMMCVNVFYRPRNNFVTSCL